MKSNKEKDTIFIHTSRKLQENKYLFDDKIDNENNQFMMDALLKNVDSSEMFSRQFNKLQIGCVLDDLTTEEYKSIFFLLIDQLEKNEFPSIIKEEKSVLRQRLDEILQKNGKALLVEILGTMKKYKKLKTLGSCYHVYQTRESDFNKIDRVWKMFYAICEEMSDIDLEAFKQCFPESLSKQIESAEEWFFWALQENLISKNDISSLEKLFKNYPNCLAIIKEYEAPSCYDIRAPSKDTDCGFAIILNYENFNGEYEDRQGSDIDVKNLQEVWKTFGFKTEVHNNLTYEETITTLKHYANLNHSNYDVFVCCILSHGQPNCVMSSDCKEMEILVLVGIITNCLSLSYKPKLFFIQACQGLGIQQGPGKGIFRVPGNEAQFPDKPKTADLSKTPVTSDTLIAVSAIDGYVSFRHKNTGTFFIQELCKALLRKGDKFNILDVMTEVNNNVQNKKVDFGPGRPRSAQQIAKIIYTMKKRLIFKRRIK